MGAHMHISKLRLETLRDTWKPQELELFPLLLSVLQPLWTDVDRVILHWSSEGL